MKRLLTCFVLFLLLASLPTFAMAEDLQVKTEDSAETQAESEETVDSSDGSEQTEDSLVEMYRAKKMPKGWKTQRTLDVDKEEITEIYNCPVRKSTVYMQVANSWGPDELKVWIQVLKDGGWVNAANMEGLKDTRPLVFVLDEPRRYRIFAKTLRGGVKSNKVKFYFVGLA